MGGMRTIPNGFSYCIPILLVFLKVGDPQVIIGFNTKIISCWFQYYCIISFTQNTKMAHIHNIT